MVSETTCAAGDIEVDVTIVFSSSREALQLWHDLRHVLKMLPFLRPSQSTGNLARAVIASHPALLAAHGSAIYARRNASTKPVYEGHTPLNWFENAFLAVGSGIVLLTNPNRAGTRASLSSILDSGQR